MDANNRNCLTIARGEILYFSEEKLSHHHHHPFKLCSQSVPPLTYNCIKVKFTEQTPNKNTTHNAHPT